MLHDFAASSNLIGFWTKKFVQASNYFTLNLSRNEVERSNF